MAASTQMLSATQLPHRYDFPPGVPYHTFKVNIDTDLKVTFIAKKNLQINEIQKILCDCVAEPLIVIENLELRIKKLNSYPENDAEWTYSKQALQRAQNAKDQKQSTETQFQVSGVTPDLQNSLESLLVTLKQALAALHVPF